MSGLGTKRDRDKGRKWEPSAVKRKRKVEGVVSPTRFKVQSPLNLEVTPDAPTIDTERRKSETEIGSKACQSQSDAEISGLTLSNISHNQEEIEISSSPVNRDAIEVLETSTFPVFTRDCVRLP
ncbi:hypothetical protein TNCV_4348901 [Trichonephila clavipes]|nr:hypothetical protein TNCV_4348901 [Trichonephila clavipes]